MGLIFLTGLPGAGKSTVGKILASKLNYAFVDLDQEIETRMGKSIPDLFAEFGEARAREFESDALASVLEVNNTVVALGGGALEREVNFERVSESGTLVYLRTDLETLVKRTRVSSSRPLLAGAKSDAELHATLAELLRRREARYSAAQVTVDASDGRSPHEIAEEILREMNGHGR